MKGRMWGGVLLLAVCECGFADTVAGARPDSGRIRAEISGLGADLYADREASQRRLRDWADSFPRYLIMELAEACREAGDLEVEHRLETLLHQLASEHIFYRPYGFLGVNFQARFLSDQQQAIEIIGVVNGEAADRAGLRTGDYLLEVGGIPISEMEGANGFVDHVSSLLPGEELNLLVERGDKQFRVDVVLGVRLPPDPGHAEYVREQEARIREWIAGLKDDVTDPERPAGHFRLSPAADESGAVQPVE
ncbi:MAG: PDZ domain-containing protein [Kiritimatiellia bacterium]